MEPLMTVREAAQVLGLKPWTVGEWARVGKLPCVKLGRAVRFKPEAIREFIAAAERAAS